MDVVCCVRRSGKSSEEVALHQRSRRIDRQLANDKIAMKRQVKLLLLGAGESGKSTFLKQMKIIHGVQFDRDQLLEYRSIIYQNVVRGMRVLVDANRKLNIPLHDRQNKLYGDQLLLFNNFSGVDNNLLADLLPMLKSLWMDPGIQTAFERRSEFQLTDSVKYFYDDLDRIADIEYLPSHQDILYCRKTTKGIVEFPLEISKIPFLFVDVGGQRTHRQKWFQCFDSVTAILFIASSSEFDQVLLEDSRKNRMQESRDIFESIVNHISFRKVSFLLFLNKMDLLEEKLKRGGDVSKHFPEEFADGDAVRQYVDKFQGDPTNLHDVKSFILYLFLTKQKEHNKQIYHHFTTAVDTRNIKFVFASVKEEILRQNLDDLMLQ